MKNGCPCKSELNYSVCCGRYHLGNLYPPTAEALMRSRYSAYVLNKPRYIYRTWHKETRPPLQSLLFLPKNKYINLKILNTDMGLESHDIGTVTFIASYKKDDKIIEHKELSTFKREGKKWVYYKEQ